MREWLENNFLFSRDGQDIQIPVESSDGQYVVNVPLEKVFIANFGEVIQAALDEGKDPKQAIRESDPNNEKGFNEIL